MARIVPTFVSVSSHLAVRYSFGFSSLLRSGGLPGVSVFSSLVWFLCPGRPAMRRGIDVDLRYCRLLDRRRDLHCASTLAPSIGRTRDSAIRSAAHCDTAHRSSECGGGLKCNTIPNLPSLLPLRCETTIWGDPGFSQTTGHSRSQK